jgi:hypothetical protein
MIHYALVEVSLHNLKGYQSTEQLVAKIRELLEPEFKGEYESDFVVECEEAAGVYEDNPE